MVSYQPAQLRRKFQNEIKYRSSDAMSNTIKRYGLVVELDLEKENRAISRLKSRPSGDQRLKTNQAQQGG